MGRSSALSRLTLGAMFVTTVIGIAYVPALQAQSAGRWLEVRRLSGNVTTQVGSSRAARIGDRLSAAGHGLTTGRLSSANFTVDTGIGSLAVAQNTQMIVRQLATLSDGSRVTILDVPRGQVRIQARSFTHTNSRLELHTPSGVAAVRGTDFGIAVDEAGKTSVATLEGQVEVSAQSITVPVDAGEVSIIRPGEPPTSTRTLDRELDIQWQTQERRAHRLHISGRIDAANTLFLGAEELAVSRSGYFEGVVPLANRNRSVVFTVRNPLGESRTHRIRLWQLPDLDRNGSD
ncbi:MAG: FecR domain-containing protein [Leptolyngbya sp. SIO1E4]|nr:FecR domain-containing protein [Leptolyngbya sp. SIO1E4]